jgi:hypothetical protein
VDDWENQGDDPVSTGAAPSHVVYRREGIDEFAPSLPALIHHHFALYNIAFIVQRQQQDANIRRHHPPPWPCGCLQPARDFASASADEPPPPI